VDILRQLLDGSRRWWKVKKVLLDLGWAGGGGTGRDSLAFVGRRKRLLDSERMEAPSS
jgi:hypothetical protein